MTRTPLSSIDTAWLRMEDPTNLMTITGVMIFKFPIDYERLRATLQDRLLPFDRFRRKVVRSRLPFDLYYWQEDPDFDLENHLQCLTLPPPGDHEVLQETVSQLMSTPLDFSKPLWEAHLVESYAEGCALIVRIHHCIAGC